ncbi:MAG: glycosyltransferase family 4 protein [Thermofilaceae archaeon]
MRLVSAAWECPFGFYGGLGTVVSRLLPSFRSLGFDVLHVCTEAHGWGYGFSRFGGAVVFRPEPSRVSGYGFLGRLEALVIGKYCADVVGFAEVVVAHDFHSFGCVLAASEVGVPSVYAVHSVGDVELDWLSSRAARRVVVNSRRTLEELEHAVGGWVGGVARVAYPPPPYGPTPRATPFRRERPVVLLLTRYQSNKDPRWVLDALDVLYRSGLEFEAVLVGRGVEAFGYSRPWLSVLGSVDEPTKVSLIRSSDLVVQTSVSEPYGLVPLEAVSLGTPALVSRGAGVSEVLRYGVVDPSDVEGVVYTLRELLESPEEREELLEKQRGEDIVKKTWVEYAREFLE